MPSSICEAGTEAECSRPGSMLAHFATLTLATLVAWISRGFRKAPTKPYGRTKQPVDPMAPGPRLIIEPPSDAKLVEPEKPNGSSSGARCLLRPRGP